MPQMRLALKVLLAFTAYEYLLPADIFVPFRMRRQIAYEFGSDIQAHVGIVSKRYSKLLQLHDLIDQDGIRRT